jgi:hypothetical protein
MKSCSVELVYFSGCPNAGLARDNIRAALVEVERDDRWVEWDQEEAATPARYKPFSSPTVLVNGQDVQDVMGAPGTGMGRSCRAGETPSVHQIVKAIRGNG